MIKTLTQLYLEKKDVRDSDIPEYWKQSFEEFMFGQTCAIEHLEDGSVQFVTYYSDFAIWYEQNQIQIKRHETINKILP
jgi:hypothetical protein